MVMHSAIVFLRARGHRNNKNKCLLPKLDLNSFIIHGIPYMPACVYGSIPRSGYIRVNGLIDVIVKRLHPVLISNLFLFTDNRFTKDTPCRSITPTPHLARSCQCVLVRRNAVLLPATTPQPHLGDVLQFEVKQLSPLCTRTDVK